MNFLIFDNEVLSLNFINKCLTEFYYVKLITSNESKSILPSSSFLSIIKGDISNASEAIEHISKHENDPFDAILIFNLFVSTSLNNVVQTLERLKRQAPRLFLIFINPQNDVDKNVIKLLKDSSELIPWTIIICNEINSSSSSTKYQIETKLNATKQQQPISASDLLDFLSAELNTKKFLNETIYFY